MSALEMIGKLAKSLIIAFVVTGLGVLGLAFCMYQFGLSGNVLELSVLFIYFLATAIAGFCVGRSMPTKQLWFALLVATIYVMILVVVSWIARGSAGMIFAKALRAWIVCLCAATLGAMRS